MSGSAPARLAWLAIAALALVMMLGNIVSATGSGLGCPDWPLCHGRFIPPGGTEIWIEFRHRLAVPLFSLLLVATAFVTIRRAPSLSLRRIAGALLGLLGVQIVLGAITVKLGLSAPVSTAHLLAALTILAGLLTIAAGPPERVEAREPKLARLAGAGLVALLIQLALGGYVRHTGAGLACPDFPLCSGDVLPGAGPPLVHWIHRWLGVLLLGFFLHVAVASRRTAMAGVGAALGVVALAQVALGIATVLLRLPVPLRAAHAAGGYVLWALLVWLAVRSGVGARLLTGGSGRVGAYAELSKFGIVLLVLVSAGAGFMLAAPLGPDFPWRAGLAVLVGVMLLSSGASALNQVQERRQDALMARTAARPLPSGRLSLTQGVAFAVLALIAGAAVLWLGISPTAGILGLIAAAFYNGLYTPWLKPTSPFAAVPGALPGSLPPVIGWVAGGGAPWDAGALILFGILFLWQMPHFWALALRYRADYAAGGFPMVSEAVGVEGTARLILLYAFGLTALSLAAPTFGVGNLVSFVVAAVLGWRLIWLATKFARQPEDQRGWLSLFLFSNFYLLLLFVVQVAERLVRHLLA